MSGPRCAAGDIVTVDRSAGSVDPMEWAAVFRARVAKQRVPVAGTLELTRRCNLDCSHCYLGSRDERATHRSAEMSTDFTLDVLAQIAEAGCLNLLITGGDPMVRPDFPEIYVQARQLGMMVTVFCNGTLVSSTIVECFREHPPQMVEMSLYGSRAETHDRVTQMPGSWQTLLETVERLKRAEVKVGLKTILMNPNQTELGAMRQLAHGLDVPFRMDAAIMPCLHPSDRSPTELRMEPRRSVELELEDEETMASWRKYALRVTSAAADNRLYQCGAGRTNFAISPEGLLSPCLVMSHAIFDLRDQKFSDLWAREMPGEMGKLASNGYPCHDCSVRAACTACPATHRLETGHEDVPGPHACIAARRRWQLLELDTVEGTMDAETP